MNRMSVQTHARKIWIGFTLIISTIFLVMLVPRLLAASGDLDTTFGVGGLVTTDIGVASGDKAFAVLQQPDESLVVVGASDNGSGSDFAAVRYLANGQPDLTFSGDGKVTVAVTANADIANTAVLQNNGYIVLAGSAFNGTDDDFAVVRLTDTGVLDPNFGTGGIVVTDIEGDNDVAQAVVMDGNGNIVVAGYGRTLSGGSDFIVVRYDSGGVLDPTFGTGGIVAIDFGAAERANGLAIQQDGKIILAGHTDAGSTGDDFAVARLSSTGILDITFDFDGKVTTNFTGSSNDLAQRVAVQNDGSIVAAGYASIGGNDDFALARYQANGLLDTSFDTDGKATTAVTTGNDQPYALTLQPTGKILLTGFAADPVQLDYDFVTARYNQNGSLDSGFGTNGLVITDLGTINTASRSQDEAYGMTVQADNKVVVAGFSDLVIGNDDFAVVRYVSPNTAPTVADVSKSGNEDADINFTAANFTAQFSDADGDTLQFVQVTSLPISGTLALNSTPVAANDVIYVGDLGGLVYTPDGDWFGADSFDWNGSDGFDYAATGAQVLITVASINDAPSFTKGSEPAVNEDAGQQVINNWATNISAGPANEASQTLTFLLNNDNSALFLVPPAISSSGTLTFRPADDAFGQAVVTAVLMDNGGTANGGVNISPSQTFTITVNSVNDAPSFVKGADQTVAEDAGAQTVSGWAASISPGPANEASQTVTFTLTTDNDALFSTLPAVDAASGDLSYTPGADMNGSATISVTLHDNGGTANGGVNVSATQMFSITVQPVNDAPVVGNVPKSGLVNAPLAFTAADFTAAFADVDGDALVKIRVEWLPAHGELRLNGTAVTLQQEILATDLGALQFIPEQNWFGSTIFGWNGSDGTVYAAQTAQVQIDIAPWPYSVFIPVLNK